MKELEAKLEMTRIQRKAIFDDIESLRANEAEKDAEIAALEQQIAEAGKPIKRSGDCCLAGGSQPAMIIGNGEDSHVLYEDGEIAYHGYERHVFACNPLFNAFDELKALKEPLTEFGIKPSQSQHRIKVTSSKTHIHITDTDNGAHIAISAGNHHAFNLGMRQIEAAMKQPR